MNREIRRAGARTLLALLFAFAAARSAFGDGTKSERRSLAGRPAVAVVVEALAPELASSGVNVDQVKTDVELRLRRSGIRVTDEVGAPYLYVVITAVVPSEERLWAFSVNLYFYQLVAIARTKESTFASTWGTGGAFLLGRASLGTLRERVADYADRFVNDYLSVNPAK